MDALAGEYERLVTRSSQGVLSEDVELLLVRQQLVGLGCSNLTALCRETSCSCMQTHRLGKLLHTRPLSTPGIRNRIGQRTGGSRRKHRPTAIVMGSVV